MLPLKVPVAQPLVTKIVEWDEYTGRFQAKERVEIRARVSGYIDEIRFRDGDMVQAGDPALQSRRIARATTFRSQP